MTNYAKLNSLVKEAQCGDKNAFDQIYRMTSRTQYYYISKILNDPCEVQDALQETYMILFKNIEKINPPNALNAYLNRLSYFVSKNIAKCKARRLHRTVGIELAEDYPEDAPLPQEQIEGREKKTIIRKAVHSLPEQQQSVIVMRYYQNLTMQEIAYSMGISRSTAQRLYRSAREQLKSTLKESGIHTAFGILPGIAPALSQVVENIPLPKSPAPAADVSPLSVDQAFPSNKAPSHTGKVSAALKCTAVLGCASCAAVLGVNAVSPPEITAVKMPSGWQTDRVSLDVTVKSTLPISEIYAEKKGGTAYKAIPQGKNQYKINVPENGDYTVILKASNGKTASRRTQVSCMDTICPEAKLIKKEDLRIWLSFIDRESGMDYSAICCISDSGIITRPSSVDKKTGTVVFDLTEEDQRLVYSDLSGNAVEAPLKIDQEE